VAGFKQRIAAHRTVGIDTVAFIYHFEQNEQYFPLTQSLFRAVLQGEIAALTSVITLAEVVMLPLRQKKIGAPLSLPTISRCAA
jgi:hypothetical protein